MPGQRHSQPTPTLLGSRVYACLGVTCHLQFWQNDRDLLRATAVTCERTPSKKVKHHNAQLILVIQRLFSPVTAAGTSVFCNLQTNKIICSGKKGMGRGEEGKGEGAKQ